MLMWWGVSCEQPPHILSKQREHLREPIAVFRLNVPLNFGHEFVEGGKDADLLVLRQVLNQAAFHSRERGFVEQDEAKERAGERPLVGTHLEHHEFEEGGQDSGEELGVSSDVFVKVRVKHQIAAMLSEADGDERVDGTGTLGADGGVQMERPHPLMQCPHDLRPRPAVQLDNVRRILRAQGVEVLEVRPHHLLVSEHFLYRKAEGELERDPQCVVEGLVSVQREHAEVDIVARERAGECFEGDGYALVSVLVRVRGQRHRQYARAVAHQHLGDFAEEQDSLGRGGVEGDALALVVRELAHKLEQGDHDVGVVPPDGGGRQQTRQIVGINPLEEAKIVALEC
mmetsp:Transcript_53897/g.117237  ORF Transcript_53897/g.117237 Transcript_53897/m.117237 type:complete len:342 (-) Transcript_53897:17-1042(-)